MYWHTPQGNLKVQKQKQKQTVEKLNIKMSLAFRKDPKGASTHLVIHIAYSCKEVLEKKANAHAMFRTEIENRTT